MCRGINMYYFIFIDYTNKIVLFLDVYLRDLRDLRVLLVLRVLLWRVRLRPPLFSATGSTIRICSTTIPSRKVLG